VTAGGRYRHPRDPNSSTARLSDWIKNDGGGVVQSSKRGFPGLTTASQTSSWVSDYTGPSRK